MAKVKILIVEDELLAAEDIKEQLEEAGYEVTGIARSYEGALKLFKQELPDLVLLDIQLDGEKNGIAVASTINKLTKVPIIYITGSAEDNLLEQAKNTQPVTFVLKPFRAKEFITNVDLAIENFARQNTKDHLLLDNAVFIPTSDGGHEKVLKDDILYVEGDGSYTSLITKYGKKYDITLYLSKLIPQLESDDLVRISKKHVINAHHLTKIEKKAIWLGEEKLSVGEHYRKTLMQRLSFIKTKP
ncbi:response regulator [Catalinimonas sp. 4WD22]|uniref:response regulator n=1 Tax=Catalinimonas locisalis TaxID=3133978 RepID=UPI003100B2E7